MDTLGTVETHAPQVLCDHRLRSTAALRQLLRDAVVVAVSKLPSIGSLSKKEMRLVASALRVSDEAAKIVAYFKIDYQKAVTHFDNAYGALADVDELLEELGEDE